MPTQLPIAGVNSLPGQPSGNSFQTPYGAQKRIEGYVKGNSIKRPLAFKPFFGDINTTWSDTVNLDIEANQRNLMGQFADPEFDVYRVQLPRMGTKEFAFAYSKEGVGSPNYSEISQRMLAEQPGAVTLDKVRLARAVAENMQTQFRLAYERFENLFELSRANILLYGNWSTTAITNSGQHRPVAWDMNRDILINPGQQVLPSANAAALTTVTAISSGANTQPLRDKNWQSVIGQNQDRIPQVDLTTLAANTSTAIFGGASWDAYDAVNGAAISAGAISHSVSPVAHLNRMLEIAAHRAGTEAIFMSDDAYSWLVHDLNTNYKDAANRFYDIEADRRIALDVMPYVKQIEGLVLRRVWNAQGISPVPIYTYSGVYHDRETGIKTPFMPNGYVLLVPPSAYGSIRFGKIQHIGAMWAAQQYWINAWKNDKTKIEQFEIHTNFVVYHTDPNSVISWKVCSGPAPVVFY